MFRKLLQQVMWSSDLMIRKDVQKMTALEYMEKQLQKHQKNFEKEFRRGVPNEQLYHILEKASHYKAACEALRKVGDGQ